MNFDRTFWKSEEPCLLLNPKLAEKDQASLLKAVSDQDRKAVVWLKSSGTESSKRGMKLVCLKKAAILKAAQAVNEFFGVEKNDVFLNVLPSFHIGGLSLYGRAFVADAAIVSLPNWDPLEFQKEIEAQKVTITSLVPTQVFDLVKNKLACPGSVRFVLVGGGALRQELYFAARELGWPVLPSYGMTETCAVMASAKIDSLQSLSYPEAFVLPHVRLEKADAKVRIESESLFDGFLWVTDGGEPHWEPRPTTFYLDDQLELGQGTLQVRGRESELVKVLGETVNLAELTQRICDQTKRVVAILPIEEARRGYDLHLCVEGFENDIDLTALNESLLPYERFKEIHVLEQFQRTELGKLNLAWLKKAIEKNN